MGAPFEELAVYHPHADKAMTRDTESSPMVNGGSSDTAGLLGLRILFIAGTLGQGGAERQLNYMLQVLKQAGCRLCVVSLTRGEFWEERIRELGIEVAHLGRSASRLPRLLRIVKFARRWRPDVVQAQHSYANGYALMAARLSGAREVGGMRGDGSAELRLLGPVFGHLSLRLPRILAVNSRTAIRNLLSMRFKEERLFFIPNVVDTARFCPATRTAHNSTTVLGVGRLGPEKRFDVFLEVLARARRSSPHSVRGVIVGDGPFRSRLERKALELALGPGALEFRGAVADMPAIYENADLLLLTSDHEGTPNVILEAMASGLPVVATRVGDVPELVLDHHTGLLCEPANIEQLAQAVTEFVQNGDLRKRAGAEARRRVEASYSIASLPGALAKLYSRLRT